MSKSSKKRNSEKRRAMKRARKEANKGMWQELAAKGLNKKKKSKDAKKKFHSQSHPYGACGNIGCKRCNPAPRKHKHLVRLPQQAASVEQRDATNRYRKRVGQKLIEP